MFSLDSPWIARTCASLPLPPGGTVSQQFPATPLLLTPPLCVTVITRKKKQTKEVCEGVPQPRIHYRSMSVYCLCYLVCLHPCLRPFCVSPQYGSHLLRPQVASWCVRVCVLGGAVLLLPCTPGPPHSAPLLEGVARRPQWQSHCPRSLSL